MSKAVNHASPSSQSSRSFEMDTPQSRQALPGKDTNKPSSIRSTVATEGVGNQRHRNKQNLDYAAKSGLAGGLAACAVSLGTGIPQL